MEKDIFKFQTSVDSKVINENLGRLFLKSGNNLRLYFSPEGVKIVLPESSQHNGDIVWLKDAKGQLLGPSTEEEK